MFSTIKLYIIGIGTAILGVLYAIIKYQSSKIDTLKEEKAIETKKADISEDMQQAQQIAETIESDAKSNIDDSNWRDKI